MDTQNIHETPDSYSIIYFEGQPFRHVSINALYSSPFTSAHSDFVRPTLSDQWTVSDVLTINNRLSYLHRTFDAVVNGDSAAFDVKRDHVAATATINGVEALVFDSQKTRGAEASLDAAITDQWHLLANVTSQDAYITDNPQGISSVGHRPQGVPDFLGNLWTTYHFAVAGIAGFRAGGGVNYQDQSYSDLTNTNSIPSSVVWNGLLDYQASMWGVDVNLRNLTNRCYFVAANGAGALVGKSRNAFVSVHADL